MTRQELDERLVDYLFDEMSADEEARFEAAISGHPDLEAEVAAHRRTRDLVAELPQRELSPEVMNAVMREARAAVAPAEVSQSWFESLMSALMQPAMVTVMLLLVVGGASVFVVTTEGEQAPMVVMEATPAEPVAAPAEEVAVATVAVKARGASAPGSAPQIRSEEVAKGAAEASAEPAARGALKPVSPTISRLVEVDAEDVAMVVGSGERATKRARPKKVARKVAKSQEVARADVAPQRASAPSIPMQPSAKSANVSSRAYEQVASVDKAAPPAPAQARYAAPAPAAPAARARARASTKSTKSAAKGAVPTSASAEGQRLAKEFDRQLRKGEVAKAEKILKRLATVPGFEATTKEKRRQLRKWRKSRSQAPADAEQSPQRKRK